MEEGIMVNENEVPPILPQARPGSKGDPTAPVHGPREWDLVYRQGNGPFGGGFKVRPCWDLKRGESAWPFPNEAYVRIREVVEAPAPPDFEAVIHEMETTPFAVSMVTVAEWANRLRAACPPRPLGKLRSGAAPTTEKGGEGVSLSQFENSEIINPALDEACDLIMRERDEQMHREWQRAERQLEKRIAIVSRFRTKKYMAQLRDLMDEVRVIHCQFVKTTGKAEKQKSEYPALKWEWVDQYENGGYSGDSYAGYIYLEVKPGRFLRLQCSM